MAILYQHLYVKQNVTKWFERFDTKSRIDIDTTMVVDSLGPGERRVLTGRVGDLFVGRQGTSWGSRMYKRQPKAGYGGRSEVGSRMALYIFGVRSNGR